MILENEKEYFNMETADLELPMVKSDSKLVIKNSFLKILTINIHGKWISKEIRFYEASNIETYWNEKNKQSDAKHKQIEMLKDHLLNADQINNKQKNYNLERNLRFTGIDAIM